MFPIQNVLIVYSPGIPLYMCLFLYVFLQQIGKNSDAANAEGCLYVQH